MKKLKKLTALFLSIALVTGCSSGKNGGSDKDKEMVYNDSKYINLTMEKPKTINPIINEFESVSYIMNLIYDGLFEIDKDYNVVPRLVEEYDIAADGLSMNLVLKDAKWHDGKSVTADDVSYTIDLINKTPDSIYRDLTENIASITVEGEKRFTIKFKNIEQFPINKLIFPIVSRDLGTKEVDLQKNNLIGNGQYKIKSYSERENMILTKNEDYYEDQPKEVKDIKVKVVPDQEARTSMVMSLDSDITDVTINDLSKFQEEKFNITKYQGREFEFVMFNFNKSYMQNPNFRKAIAHSINRKNLFEEGYMKDATLVNFPLNSKSEYYNDKIGQLSYNKEKAQVYLDKIKFTGDEDNKTTKNTDRDNKNVKNHNNQDNNADQNKENANNKDNSVDNNDLNKNELDQSKENDSDTKEVINSKKDSNTKNKSNSEDNQNIKNDQKNNLKQNTIANNKNKTIKSLNDINLSIIVNRDNTDRVKTANLISANLKSVGINSTVEQLTAEELEKAMNTNNYDLAVTGWVLSNVPDVKDIISYSGYSDEKLTGYLTQLESATSKENIKKLYGLIQKDINENVGFISLVVRNNHIVTNNRLDGKINPNDYDVYEGISNLNIKTKNK